MLVLENAYYSVISPEGCASILWKDRAAAPAAADALKITSDHLKRFGLVDEVIPEPLGGAHNDIEATASTLKKHLLKHIKSIKRMEPGDATSRPASLRGLSSTVGSPAALAGHQGL